MKMILVLKNSTDALEISNKLLRNYQITGKYIFLKYASSAKAYGAAVSKAVNQQVSEM